MELVKELEECKLHFTFNDIFFLYLFFFVILQVSYWALIIYTWSIWR